MPFKLTLNAKDDLERIWNYGVDQFGEKQANTYYDTLFAKFQDIANSPLHHPLADDIREGYRKCVSGSDTIYFRIMTNYIEITTIIGQQDTTTWL